MSGVSTSLKVLSVVGAGRSGTTVLASILGEVDGFASAGELRWVWQRGVKEERPCGCGRTPASCPVWSPVLTGALADLHAVDPSRAVDDIIAAQRVLTRRRHLPRVLSSLRTGRRSWDDLETVRAATGALCASFSDITGCRVLVDTSKRAVDAAVVAGLEEVDHYVLHIVRDPRAVVHSWRRAKTFTAEGRTRTMGTRRLPSTVRRWTASALAAEALRPCLPASRWLHIRYEDFAAEPRLLVGQILAFLGEDAALPFVDDHTVALGPNHIVAGNPSRFTTGRVGIRADDEWRRAMSRRDQRLVGLLTLPLLLRYGYPAGLSLRHSGPEAYNGQ